MAKLKIIRIGRKNAPHCVLLRGRSHPWESGGNWVLEGLIKSLLERFGIEAFIFELNADWIAGRNKVPDSGDWLAMGSDLRKVFMSYFEGL